MTDDDRAVSRLWAMAHLGTPMAIRVAATLRIADHLAAGRQSPADLAAAVDADADALDRLMRYLAARGVFAREACGRYHLTPLAEVLRDDHPSGLRRGLDADHVGRADLAFVQLLHSVRTGGPGYPEQFGRSFWADLAADAERREVFTAWMGSDMPERSPAILTACDWASCHHLVDVGGGSGGLLIALLSRFPRLRGTVLDLPQTADDARKAVAAAGLTDRCEVVGGSFFEPLVKGADGYLLSMILHNWPDPTARTILTNCAEAAGSRGRVFVIERTGADGSNPHTGMDLRMLVLYGGKERSLPELGDLAADCGLRVVGVRPADEFSVIELRASG